MSGRFRAGDVVEYETLDRPNRHCREGIAIAEERGPARVVLLDTFWGPGGEKHILTPDEERTAQLLFSIGDYDELDRYSPGSPGAWAKYAPADRRVVTSQHGLQKRWFIRKGAPEHWPTQIENARLKVAERESDLAAAERSLQWAREDLAQVIAAAANAEGDA